MPIEQQRLDLLQIRIPLAAEEDQMKNNILNLAAAFITPTPREFVSHFPKPPEADMINRQTWTEHGLKINCAIKTKASEPEPH